MKKKIIFILFMLCVSAAIVWGYSDWDNLSETLMPAPTEEITVDIPENTPAPVMCTNPYESIISRFAYEQLNEQERELYRRIEQALFAFEPEIEGGMEGFTFEQVTKVNTFVLIDRPEIFWARANGTGWSSTVGGETIITRYELNYWMTQEQKEQLQAEINIRVNAFLDSVPLGLNEYERILMVYEYIINNTEFLVGAQEEANREQPTEADLRTQTIVSVFVDNMSVCAGYSRATQYLLNRLGVFCTYVTGIAREENHAWNLVRVEGDYYFLDTTWGDSMSMNTGGEKRILYNYFLVTTEEINRTHTPDGLLVLPEATATRFNYFVFNNWELEQYDLERIEEIVAEAVGARRSSAMFRFTDLPTAEKANHSLFEDDQDIFGILRRVAERYPHLNPRSVAQLENLDHRMIYIGLVYE